ncbi:MAG: PLP-dependent aminotransferase family protein [Clostridia bacterium]|nr:PLP-dependent aminotransferase family protein [Clostridia bacterium]
MLRNIWELDDNLKDSLYVQIFNAIKEDILDGKLEEGERLPSLRNLSKDAEVSLTTVDAAYSQLLVEGYITSIPKSGYYVSKIYRGDAAHKNTPLHTKGDKKETTDAYMHDAESFDFVKWKKCMNKVFNEYANQLHMESDPQGEYKLRQEIAKYVYTSRGVKCSPNQVVIGAGAQQLTVHLTRILRLMEIDHVSTEMPGYTPVQNIFQDSSFTITKVPIKEDGITIEKLPTNIKSLVYVSPSNQFPSGAVMPIGRRYALLKWAQENDSYILEDDYDSELRYFGRPIPAMQGLDTKNRVIYLGSFSSTLFSAIKISYIILPDELVKIFNKIKGLYSQTCSKSEQLCLALFMEEGHYYRNIKKCRRLFSQKLNESVRIINKYGSDFIELTNTKSGINITLKIKTERPAKELSEIAKKQGILLRPVNEISDDNNNVVSLYYNKIPIKNLEGSIKNLILDIKGSDPNTCSTDPEIHHTDIL